MLPCYHLFFQVTQYCLKVTLILFIHREISKIFKSNGYHFLQNQNMGSLQGKNGCHQILSYWKNQIVFISCKQTQKFYMYSKLIIMENFKPSYK